jgi:hypothetical protein
MRKIRNKPSVNPVSKRFKQIYQLNRPGLIVEAITTFPFDRSRIQGFDFESYEEGAKAAMLNGGQLGFSDYLREVESQIFIDDNYVEPWESWVSAWATEINKNLKPIDNAIRKFAYQNGIKTDVKYYPYSSELPNSIYEMLSEEDLIMRKKARALMHLESWGWPEENAGMSNKNLTTMVRSGISIQEILDLAEEEDPAGNEFPDLEELFARTLFTQRGQKPKDFGRLLYEFNDGDYLVQLINQEQCLVEGSRRMLANCLREAGRNIRDYFIVYRDASDRSRGAMRVTFPKGEIPRGDLVGPENERLNETSTFEIDGEMREPGLITARLVSYAFSYLEAKPDPDVDLFNIPEVLNGEEVQSPLKVWENRS